MDLRGVLSVDVDASERGWRVEWWWRWCLSLYRLTTPLSAPTARTLEEDAMEEVMVPSWLWKRSMHLRLRMCHLWNEIW